MSDKIDDVSAGPEPGKEEDKVGYKSPPKKHQFKKGESGNPKGSKKQEEISDIRIVMQGVFAELVKVSEGGKVRIVSREEAIMNAELMNALNGDPKAIEALFKRGQKCGLFSKANSTRGPIIEELKGDNGKIVRMFHAERRALQRAAEESDVGTRKTIPDETDH
jgi:Family of unknown function (DUF5681)